MARRRRLSSRLIGVFLGLGLLGIGGWGWAHRAGLERRFLWWEVRRLEALRGRDPEAKAFQPTENRGLSRFDVAFSRLVRHQRPEFLGGREVLFLQLRGRHGRTSLAAVYETMPCDFESPVEEDEPEVVVFCRCKTIEILLLDGNGNLLGDLVRDEVWDDEPIRVVSRGSYDVLRLLSGNSCMACYDAQQSRPWKEFSVDSGGLVDHGPIASDVPGAPLCGGSKRAGRPRPAPVEIGELLGSGLAGDAHRAFTAIQSGASEDAELVEPLLRHEEPLIRARAAVLASRVPGLREAVFSLLDDPDPGVRAGAITACRKFPDWEAALQPVAQGSDAAVARRARLELAHSADPVQARTALLRLVRDHERAALYRRHTPIANGELRDALLDWFEESLPYDSITRSEISDRLHAYPTEILLERTDRIIMSFAKLFLEGDASELIEVLAKLDDPRADAVLGAGLVTPGWGDAFRIVRTLYERGTPVRSESAVEALLALLEENGPCYGTSCPAEAAAVVLRTGRGEGLHWALENLEPYEGDALPETLLGWASGPHDLDGKWTFESEVDVWGRHVGWGDVEAERP